MNAYIGHANVSGYEELIQKIILPDPNDCHVLAAAIHANADTIVTCNLKDFPTHSIMQYEIEAVHRDEFLLRLLSHDSDRVCSAVKQQRESLKTHPRKWMSF